MERLPLIRSLRKSAPSYFAGSVVENELGSQVAKVLSKNISWRLRSKRVTAGNEEYVSSLDRNGILVINNFLADTEFDLVKKEYSNAIRESTLRPYKEIDAANLHRIQIPVSHSERFRSIEKHFQNNSVLDDIAGAVVHRKIVKRPEVFLDFYKKVRSSGVENDIENILHADLHAPTVKMFFYLDRVDENNGAFVYAKGSHRLTLQRLRHEYEMSIREARLRNGKRVESELLERRGSEVRNVISPKMLEKMRVSETHLCVGPNTLLVANNMGFHRRGEFLLGTERKSILINYRNAERVFF